MDIITYCIEERRIDRSGNTIRTEGRFATRDRDGGLRTFAAARPTRYRPGSGFRLVLVTRGGDR
ncbi:hypothetical protein [Micromonospora aurantiaca]|uniref:Uncharacterized protein n=1 Tax=Micromonospora aurantiaca (nom. illeg.) TaxID=47850 RepID=A0A6N3JV03_9ACTN|nr:hypothetical protein [Micromonospora aurantiaca]AXH89381.1 hypothetical protein DVH21_05210 [Micromonospora aurantiaca]